MTTLWKITPDWAGQTVAVLGSGPSLTQEAVAALAKHRCIAVNYSFVAVPDADMLVALDLDPLLWGAAADFEGIKVCGVDCDNLDALYAGPMYERITLAADNVIETRNSGLAAIRIAARMGATKIILAGFDPESSSHFEGRPNIDVEPDPGNYTGLAQGLAALVAEIQSQGITVERYAPRSKKVA